MTILKKKVLNNATDNVIGKSKIEKNNATHNSPLVKNYDLKNSWRGMKYISEATYKACSQSLPRINEAPFLILLYNS